MSLKLEALLPVEGVGIVRDNTELRLVQPPYRLSDAPTLPATALRDAILKYDYVASGEEFETWGDLIEYLNRQVVESRTRLGRNIPESVAYDEIVAVAPPEVISGFLDRVESELIPRGSFDHADNLLLAVLSSDLLIKTPALSARAGKLLRRSKESRARAGTGTSTLASEDLRFASLERSGELKKSMQIAERIRCRHSIFELCS
jgi:hypothetical protein